MTLIVRYLSAVRDHLPRGEQDDIINELSDNLRSRFEDEEAARGRPLEEEEEVAILKEFGHPMAVAARYRGDERTVTFGRRLIGPELFSIYMKVLAINVAVTVLIGLIALVAGATLWSGFAGILVPLAIQFMIVTAIFVWIDRRWVRDPDGWDPRTVNAMGPDIDVSTLDGLAVQLLGKEYTRSVSVAASVLEIGVLAIVLTVALNIGLPEQIGFMEPGPGWSAVYWPSIAVIVRRVPDPHREYHPPAVDAVPGRVARCGRLRGDRPLHRVADARRLGRHGRRGVPDGRRGEPHRDHQRHRPDLDRGDDRPHLDHRRTRGAAVRADGTDGRDVTTGDLAGGTHRLGRRGRSPWHDAELAHEGHVVPDAPLLDDLAVAEPQEVDVGVGDRSTGGRDAHQVAGMPAMVDHVARDEIAFTDQVLDLPALFAEHARQPEHRPLDALVSRRAHPVDDHATRRPDP